MGQIVTATVLNQQVQANQIRQARTVLDAVMPGHRAAWLKFGTSEEVADLLYGNCSWRLEMASRWVMRPTPSRGMGFPKSEERQGKAPQIPLGTPPLTRFSKIPVTRRDTRFCFRGAYEPI